MKISGRKLANNNLEIIVLPRNDGDLVFKFKPILDLTDFDAVCKEPTPIFITDARGTRNDLENPKYKASLLNYLTLKQTWMFLYSISATDNLEWETVNLGDPSTWDNYRKELQDSGISEIEFSLMYRAFQKVNSLNEDHLTEARERFLATIQESQVT